MRALLFTAEEPLYLPRYLEPVLDAHADAFEAVVVANPPNPPLRQVRAQLRMFGPRAFVRMGAKYARGRLLDGLDRLGGGLGRHLGGLGPSPDGLDPLGVRATGRYHSVETLARAHDLPVRRADDVSDPGFAAWVRELDPDLLLSVVCGQHIPGEVLDAADDAVNLHGSLLPKYRGRATAFWPLYYGDDETGVTAHRMTETWDGGPIIERRRVPIGPDDTVHSLYLKLARAGGDLAVSLLDRYPCAFETRPNDSADEDYHSLPTPTQRRAFLRDGNRFL